jgi:2-(1,2-epoxy-1,2-dihydrophenyl)acetyl-CoA isomerase
MRAERLPADKALEWGAVNEVVPVGQFRDAARRVALDYANGPTIALGVMRELFERGPELTLDEHLEMEVRGVAATCRTKDNNAAIMNFGKKEKPVFTGE